MRRDWIWEDQADNIEHAAFWLIGGRVAAQWTREPGRQIQFQIWLRQKNGQDVKATIAIPYSRPEAWQPHLAKIIKDYWQEWPNPRLAA